MVTANNDSTVTAYGAQGKFTLTPLPDGVTTVFHLPNNFGYIAGTEEVFINGLFQIPGEIYQNTGSGVGTVTFLSAPVTGDDLFITCWMTGT